MRHLLASHGRRTIRKLQLLAQRLGHVLARPGTAEPEQPMASATSLTAGPSKTKAVVLRMVSIEACFTQRRKHTPPARR
jgi:hypothetical protein